MKKITSEKRIIISIAKRREKARRHYSFWLKAKRKRENFLPKKERKHRADRSREQKRFKSYEPVKAPEDFSLNENTENVVAFIGLLERRKNEGKSTFVNLNDVARIDYGAIVSLLSIMIQFRESNIKFNGNFPRAVEPKEKLDRSGFLPNLYQKIRERERYCISNTSKQNAAVTYAWKLVDTELSAKIVREASVTIWGVEKRCQGVQRCIGELMLNTNNHAEIGSKGVENWWLYVSHNVEAKVVSFAFVDFGVGIFQSLKNKPSSSKFFGWFEKITEKFLHGDNANVLKLIMSGEFHQTVTGKYYRGKGLPGIAEAMKRNQLSNLMILSNGALGNVATGEYRSLKVPFNGTYVYWELNEENECCE